MLPSYQFLGSAYYKTTSKELSVALDSINAQILKPLGTILVLDGEVKKDTEEIINRYKLIMDLQIVRLQKNHGLGIALREGLKYCSAKYILRFDTDDYNIPSRSFKQIQFIEKGGFDIISSWIYEFSNNFDIPKRLRKVPLEEGNIKKTIYRRNPFNHPAICFKRKSILRLEGGYRNYPYYEDYDLWIRAVFSDLKLANMKELLVGMNASNQLESRSGYKIILYESKLINTFKQFSNFAMCKFLIYFSIRTIIRLMPLKLLEIFYYRLLRSKPY